MIDAKIIDLNDEEHHCCQAWEGRGPASGDRAQSDERSAESSDRTSTPGGDLDIRLEDCERTRCEVWTRVMGYHRPVSAFNAGKRSEHLERQYFSECQTVTAERMVERAATGAHRIKQYRSADNRNHFSANERK